jgi:hypothetical protein
MKVVKIQLSEPTNRELSSEKTGIVKAERKGTSTGVPSSNAISESLKTSY